MESIGLMAPFVIERARAPGKNRNLKMLAVKSAILAIVLIYRIHIRKYKSSISSMYKPVLGGVPYPRHRALVHVKNQAKCIASLYTPSDYAMLC